MESIYGEEILTSTDWRRGLRFPIFHQGPSITPAEPPWSATSTGAAGAGLRTPPWAQDLMIPSVPVLYEGINERGLMGGQLYYREFAHFADKATPGTLKIQPPYVVYHVLAQCATVAEAADLLKNKVTIMNLPLFGSVPTLHWAFSDRTGEMIVVEPGPGRG